MALKLQLFVVFALAAYFVHSGYAKPRDSTVFTNGNLHSKDVSPEVSVVGEKVQVTQDVRIPGRISCQTEDIDEDPICQEHCLPKGYSYGICVGHTCSCI